MIKVAHKREERVLKHLPVEVVEKAIEIATILDDNYLMGQLVKDYSVQNNVSQKSLFEVALVEFFRKHGYGKEVNTLLGV